VDILGLPFKTPILFSPLQLVLLLQLVLQLLVLQLLVLQLLVLQLLLGHQKMISLQELPYRLLRHQLLLLFFQMF
jgi:hypothetical protein